MPDRMDQNRPLFVVALLVGIMLPMLVGAGVYLHRFIGESLGNVETVQMSSRLTRDILALQLDQETGVRGFAATGEREFLQPYTAARSHFDADIDRLTQQLQALNINKAATTAQEAKALSHEWLHKVAEPILVETQIRAKAGLENRKSRIYATQKLGKRLMDQFRTRILSIEDDLYARRLTVADQARMYVDRITIFVSVTVGCMAILGFAFLFGQLHLSERLNRARQSADEDRRRVGELRVAFQTEKRIADNLQEALSQRPLPALTAVQFSAMYMPAEEEAKVGGDWYDAVELANNRALFVIGDVAGHGVDAAVGMSKARHAFIGSALQNEDPARMLAIVNEELVAQNSPMVTAVCGLADASRYEFTFATAGHPPPLLIEPGRAPRLLECGGLPLGIIAGSEYTTFRVQTVPGAILVLYTDGAVEHSRSVLEGEKLLLEAAAYSVEVPGIEPARAIHRRIFANRPAGDDVAILTIGFVADAAPAIEITADRKYATLSAQIESSVTGDGPIGRMCQLLPFMPRKKSAAAQLKRRAA